MRLAVCDDSIAERTLIVSVIEDFFSKLDTTCLPFSSGEELVEYISKTNDSIDAIFLDIEMGQMDGMTAAHEVRKALPNVPIIFITSHKELAPDGYEVQAFRFVCKPIDRNKLISALSSLKTHLLSKVSIVVRHNGEDVIIPLDSILWIESDNNDVRIICENKTITTRMRLRDAWNELSDISTGRFAYSHRCTIVNLSHVKSLSSSQVKLDNGASLMLSRGCEMDLKNQLFEYVRHFAH
ncbi:MAG TPA: LytTR family DNA-binding domain-containing protein [Saccharofermentans sp.]|jgi:DNA-binding LytR/AlgR family response regulator|nr:LytTR family DNA-binding domain-containing protein [Saccharofermentans sp.]HPE27696.1 LytTR family DNA-binding domain-containing protein [Saccharofermentans sp.]HPJ81222.1 LytTR family DNA-binding domain-containing protein [Saccharofermentans sp.]HPQ32487.1 LytTR family DNA-binding domain-containing protein [Saccharofermentans sp.]HRV50847.1 LytTR family DNA-binding domain-containing protein [Saccharofermentans sp.]